MLCYSEGRIEIPAHNYAKYNLSFDVYSRVKEIFSCNCSELHEVSSVLGVGRSQVIYTVPLLYYGIVKEAKQKDVVGNGRKIH